MCFAKRNGLRAKTGGLIFPKTTHLSSARALLQTWKSWNGKHVNKESFVSMRDKAKDSKRLRTSGEALRISGDPQSPPEAAP